ncbi:MAG TPA: D-sedoheptulose 7-phosphate isomerase [Candidatus Omnitrophota bacterium]|jgi:D-sedoheptulose 7-phosphate isomerase|nr:D-sedoheptulose 7-phosphate isomerase [Candidatus Omnitrophota bacterium]
MRQQVLNEITQIFEESIAVKKETLLQNSREIQRAVDVIVRALRRNKKLLVFGNGGSAADSQHIAAEFIGRFQKERASFPAIALTTDSSALTALGNDYGFEHVFSRQMEGLGRKGDVALAISTSGMAANVIKAVQQARAMGITVIALTGRDGGRLAPLADVKIVVPSSSTARIQESHVCIVHCVCACVENILAS